MNQHISNKHLSNLHLKHMKNYEILITLKQTSQEYFEMIQDYLIKAIQNTREINGSMSSLSMTMNHFISQIENQISLVRNHYEDLFNDINKEENNEISP